METIITSYIPNAVNNPYALNVRRIIQQQGYLTVPIKKCLTNPRVFCKCRIFNFNWYDKAASFSEYIRKKLLITMLSLSGKKIVYTLHNKQPHNQLNSKYSLRIMRYMCKKADAIVGLCPDTKQVLSDLDPMSIQKLHIIPHPNYVGNYDLTKGESLRAEYGISDADMVFLFLGFISPYKNVELLIDTFKKIKNRNVKLLIAGNPSSISYKDQLIERMSGSSNIICDFRYIPDDEIEKFYNTADIVVLPYHKTSSLNSGAVYLSFSLQKTVICPDIGTINALEDHTFVYDYKYEDESEHSKRLEEVIFQVCADYEECPEIIRKKGMQAYDYVSRKHSDEEIGALYRELYRGLVEKNH